MRVPISLKLIFYFLTVSIISIFIVGEFSYFNIKNALISRTFDQLISIRLEKEKRVRNFFDQRISDILNIVKHEDTKKIFSHITEPVSDSIFSKYLFGYLQASNCYNKVIFIDSSSRILTYELKENSFNHCEVDNCKLFYTNFSNDRKINDSIVIKEYISIHKNHVIGIVAKLINESKKVEGTLILELTYEPINEIMFENDKHNGLGNTGEVYLVGNDYLMRSSSRFKSNSVFETKVETIGVIDAFNFIQGEKKIKDYRNIEVFSSYNKLSINNLDWVILAEIDVKEAMISIISVENNIIYLSIIVSLLLLGVIAVLSANITSPIRQLQAETENILKGEYGKIINIKSHNEIGDLIKAFNKMTVQLKEQAEKIEYEHVIRTTAVIDGQEEERQRLSRELHDGLAQYILAIKVKLEHALSMKGKEQNLIIEETKNLFSETIKEIRNISNNLMPSELIEFGLIKAIKNLSKTVNQETDLEFIFKCDFTQEVYSKKIKIYLYRIIQEALNNTIKHSQASKFSVDFTEDGEKIILIIEDNGKGFDYSKRIRKSGNGLVNMKERVSLLSGKMQIFSKKNNGVKISISIPL